MQVEGHIFMRVNCLRVGHDSLDGKCFNFVHILNILDEILVANFFGVAASGVPSAQQICELLVSDEAEVVEHSDELFSGDDVAVGAIVVLKRRLDEDSLAGHCPSNVVQNLLDLPCIVPHSSVVSQLAQVGLRHIGVSELLVDDRNKL